MGKCGKVGASTQFFLSASCFLNYILAYITCSLLVYMNIYAYIYIYYIWASLVAQGLKRLPAMRETWVRSLGWEDPLEKEIATHSTILAWRIPWTEEPGGLQSTRSQRVVHD